MQVTNVKIVDLKAAKYNPRKISDDELAKLVKSLKEFGFVDPIVVNKDFTVIGGHQRIEAAKNLGMEEVPVTFVDLDKKKEKLLNLALNRIGGEWDQIKLRELVIELGADITLGGFDDLDVARLMNENLTMGKEIDLASLGDGLDSSESKTTCPSCGHVF